MVKYTIVWVEYANSFCRFKTEDIKKINYEIADKYSFNPATPETYYKMNEEKQNKLMHLVNIGEAIFARGLWAIDARLEY